MGELKIDFEGLGKEIGAEGLSLLKGYFEGAKDDLKSFGMAIGADLVHAVRSGDEEWRAELMAQIKTVAEIQRVRLNGISWELATSILFTIAKVAVKAIGFAVVL